MCGRDSLRHARRIWESLGGRVEDVRRTGEERYSHPGLSRSIKVNKRRKDVPRKLFAAIKRIEKLFNLSA